MCVAARTPFRSTAPEVTSPPLQLEARMWLWTADPSMGTRRWQVLRTTDRPSSRHALVEYDLPDLPGAHTGADLLTLRDRVWQWGADVLDTVDGPYTCRACTHGTVEEGTLRSLRHEHFHPTSRAERWERALTPAREWHSPAVSLPEVFTPLEQPLRAWGRSPVTQYAAALADAQQQRAEQHSATGGERIKRRAAARAAEGRAADLEVQALTAWAGVTEAWHAEQRLRGDIAAGTYGSRTLTTTPERTASWR